VPAVLAAGVIVNAFVEGFEVELFAPVVPLTGAPVAFFST